MTVSTLPIYNSKGERNRQHFEPGARRHDPARLLRDRQTYPPCGVSWPQRMRLSADCHPVYPKDVVIEGLRTYTEEAPPARSVRLTAKCVSITARTQWDVLVFISGAGDANSTARELVGRPRRPADEWYRRHEAGPFTCRLPSGNYIALQYAIACNRKRMIRTWRGGQPVSRE